MWIRSLKTKPDFELTIERFAAWWRCEVIDRPPVSIGVKSSKPYRGPTKQHATVRERWLDIDFNIDRTIGWIESATYIADSFPVIYPNVGPELTATLLGCELDFNQDSSWSVPLIHDPSQWGNVLHRAIDWNNIYWQTIERATQRAIDKCDGRYIVGIADLHGAYDILAALRDPQALCMDLLDCPELVRPVGMKAADVYVESFNRLYRMISAAGFGSTTWTPIYHEGPAYLPNCDFWCMVSEEIADDLIVPSLAREQQPLERSLFHLDGPQALRHLDAVLNLQGMSGVQWVFGAGNGPASRWIDIYKKIVAAGKCVQVTAESPQDALDVLRAVGPRGVWLTMWHAFDTLAAAEAYLHEVERIGKGW